MNGMRTRIIRPPIFALITVLLWNAALLGAATASAAGGVTATATIDGKPIAGATAASPVRLDPDKVTPVVIEVKNESANPITLRRVDLTGHVLGLNFYSYSTSVELTVAAGKTEKLTYRLDPAGLDGQATGLIGSDLTLIDAAGDPVTSVHTVVDVRGSLVSVYGLFGIILAVLTGLAIADSALTVARQRLSANRWQRGLRLLAPGIGLGLMIGFTASVARWWVPGTGLWLALAGVFATIFFLAGYLSPTPRDADDLGLDQDELAAALELDAAGQRPGGTRPDLTPVGGTPFPGYGPAAPGYQPAPGPSYQHVPPPREHPSGPVDFGPTRVFGSGEDEPTIRTGPHVVRGNPEDLDATTVQGVDSEAVRRRAEAAGIDDQTPGREPGAHRYRSGGTDS